MTGRFSSRAIALLARLAPLAHREALAGDLIEELAVREGAGSSAARLWLLRQVVASFPPLARAALARTRWLSTLALAGAGYVGVGVVEFGVNWALSGAPVGGGGYRPLGLALTFPVVVLISAGIATVRRGAPWVMGSAMLLAVTVMTLTSAEQLPLAYRLAYFVAGPMAVGLGALLRRGGPAHIRSG